MPGPFHKDQTFYDKMKREKRLYFNGNTFLHGMFLTLNDSLLPLYMLMLEMCAHFTSSSLGNVASNIKASINSFFGSPQLALIYILGRQFRQWSTVN